MLSIDDLYRLYRDYNYRFFNAELPTVQIEYSDKMTRQAGLFSPSEPLIRLSIPLLTNREQETKDTLIHEMIHGAQFFNAINERPHGAYFSAFMARINSQAQGEVTVTVTHHILSTENFETSSMLGKIKKLLALSDSPNENEAYAAAQKVQALMAIHDVQDADLKMVQEGSELDEPLINEVIEAFGARTVAWKFSLLGAICRVNHCRCVGGGHHGIRAIGRSTHVEICRSYYHYFVQVVENEAAQHRGKGRVFLNRFREAMVQEIAQRLQQQFQQHQTTEQNSRSDSSAIGLAHQYEAEVAQFVSWVYPTLKNRQSSARWADASATHAGRTAGSKAAIAKHIVPKTRRLGT
ncbi:MAG: SprT-like domain-containing protein [Thermosynechococcaceae cyanobacterium]